MLYVWTIEVTYLDDGGYISGRCRSHIWTNIIKRGMKLHSHSQTSAVAPLKLVMDKQFHPTFYDVCDYLSMLRL